MADGALNNEVEVDEPVKGGALTDPLIAKMSGPDRMSVDLMAGGDPETGAGGVPITKELVEENVSEYKDRTGDIDLDGTKDNVWDKFKGWWKKGKEGGDDPTTADVDEGDPDYQVTGFMGGMTRQELATFVFQWGASMMVNADKGLGGAFGQSALDAEGAHRGRQMQQAETEKSDAQQKIQNQLDKEKMGIDRQRASGSALSNAYTDPETGYYMVPKYDAETKEWNYEVDRDDDGKPRKGPLTSANRPFAAQQLQSQLEGTGFFTDEEIAMLIAKQPGKGVVQKDAIDAWEKRVDSKTYPRNPATGKSFTSTQWKALSEEQRNKYRSQFVDDYVGEYMRVYEKAGGGALSDADAAARALQATAD